MLAVRILACRMHLVLPCWKVGQTQSLVQVMRVAQMLMTGRQRMADQMQNLVRVMMFVQRQMTDQRRTVDQMQSPGPMMMVARRQMTGRRWRVDQMPMVGWALNDSPKSLSYFQRRRKADLWLTLARRLTVQRSVLGLDWPKYCQQRCRCGWGVH